MDSSFQIINGTSLSDMCDYSFGDHIGGSDPQTLKGGFMKYANQNNKEFFERCKEFEGKVMTLFIDNIRLYNRPIWVDPQDAKWVEHLLGTNDLLYLCETLPNNKFVIFCSHEDTPIDKYIHIPPNVLGIHAVNAENFGEKVHPFPYGLQRVIGKDDRLKIMKEKVERDEEVVPTKLLYINCGIGRNKDREYLVNFEGLDFVTTRFDKDSKYFPYEKYGEFLRELQDHKFMICPEGHGMDCHRNWESLYLRRVPVMKKSPYFTRLMDGFPILFVDDWPDVTKELLEQNDHLFQQAKSLNLNKLDLNLIFNTIVKSYEDN